MQTFQVVYYGFNSSRRRTSITRSVCSGVVKEHCTQLERLMTVGTAARLTVIPPDRGSFPLDHEGECKELSDKYVKCIGALKGNALGCRHLAAQYMQCRIDHKLLVEEPLTNFGFRECDINPTGTDNTTCSAPITGKALVRPREERKEAQGFVAGGAVVDNYAKEESYLSKLLSKFLE